MNQEAIVAEARPMNQAAKAIMSEVAIDKAPLGIDQSIPAIAVPANRTISPQTAATMVYILNSRSAHPKVGQRG
jgi:hypothetical protein